MTAKGRPIDLACGTLGSHRHVCAFFEGPEEEHRVLRSFVKDGLDGGEKAFHVVAPELRQAYLDRLAAGGIDVESASSTGQLEVVPWGEAYLREDRFQQDDMLALVEEMLRSNAAAGYPSTRIVAHMEWALEDRPGVEDLLEYETRANYLLARYDSPVVCAYDLSRFNAAVAMDVLRTHPAVILGGVLQENPFYVAPDRFLLEIRERRAARRVAKTAI